jgi:hypothetical protein
MDCFVARRNDEGGTFIPSVEGQIALFLMDCRVIPDQVGDRRPAMTELEHEWNLRMRPNSARLGIALLLVTPLLAGCLERGQPTMVNAGGDDDDAFCRASNAVGSPEYVACRKDRDVQRNNANARADKQQRNLGEYMLNNPVRP